MRETQTMSLLFGVDITPSSQELSLALTIANIADTAGLDFLSMQDHPYNPNFLDTWTELSVLGARTQRVRLLSNVSSLPMRPPAMLAKAAASLDLLTDGRVELGLGAGHFWEAIVSYGFPHRTPGEAVDALEEAMHVIRALWQPSSSPSVSFSGRYYQLTDAHPGPAPAHPIRIWLGAQGPHMVQLTGRLADGWSISASRLGPEEILRSQQTIDEAAHSAGRDPSAIIRNHNLAGIVQSPGKLAAAPQQNGLLVGEVGHWVEELVRMAQDLHMNSFTFSPCADEREEQVRLFAEEVVPAVREHLCLR